MTGEICGSCPLKDYCETKTELIAEKSQVIEATRSIDEPTFVGITSQQVKAAQVLLNFEATFSSETLPRPIQRHLTVGLLTDMGLTVLQISRLRVNQKTLPTLYERRLAQEQVEQLHKVLSPFSNLFPKYYCDDGVEEELLPSGAALYMCNHPGLDPLQRYQTRFLDTNGL